MYAIPSTFKSVVVLSILQALQISGLRSLPDMKSLFLKFCAPVPSGQTGDIFTFSTVKDSIDALVILNNRFVLLFLMSKDEGPAASDVVKFCSWGK